MLVGGRRIGVIAAIIFGVAVLLPAPNGPRAAPARESTPRAAPRRFIAHHPAAGPRGDTRFLILGLPQDNRRTDTIEVVQWDETRGRLRILGVPRDIGVPLPGIGTTKLVHAYATGGVGPARAAVVGLLNVPIAHYAVFSLPAMRRVVDLIGGVPLDVEKRMTYADRRQQLVIDLSPGPQVLSGEKAEEYLRFRNDAEADIGRIRRQQHFLRAAVQVRKPSVLLHLPAIVEAARPSVQTDLTSPEILGWIGRIRQLAPDAVSAASIGGRPAVLYDALAGAPLSFWIPDHDDLRTKVRWLVTGAAPGGGPQAAGF